MCCFHHVSVLIWFPTCNLPVFSIDEFTSSCSSNVTAISQFISAGGLSILVSAMGNVVIHLVTKSNYVLLQDYVPTHLLLPDN
jgi:hypothetical protein